MVETAEEAITELRKTVSDLQKSVSELSQIDESTEDFHTRKRTVAELITQELVKIDSVQISKDAAVEAMREGDRAKSQKLAVLLSRRKNLVKKLNELGDQVDKLSNEKES